MKMESRTAAIHSSYRILTISIVLAATAVFQLAGANEAHFPNSIAVVDSPNGQFRITSSVSGNQHKLAISKVRQRGSKVFYLYTADADVLWSPDNKRFALNDNCGSNLAYAFLFDVGNLSKPVNLLDRLTKSQSNDLKCLKGSTHLYINALNWVDRNRLKLIITGKGSPMCKHGFTLFYLYDLNGSVKKLGRLDAIHEDRLYNAGHP